MYDNLILNTSFSFRLFYLYIETFEKHITEENFFKCCVWLCHTLCGITISMVVGDCFLVNEYDSAIIQRSCAKMPKWILVEQERSLPWSFIIGNIVLVFGGLGIHFAIFFKQRHLERKQAEIDYVITFNKSEVQIVRKSKQTSDSMLWRFRRNVISPLGSFSSFLTTLVFMILFAYLLFSIITPSGPSVLCEIVSFLVHVVFFLFISFVETIFSPTLRSSLNNVIPIIRKVLGFVRSIYNTVIKCVL